MPIIDNILESPDKKYRKIISNYQADKIVFEPWVGIIVHHTGNTVDKSSNEQSAWNKVTASVLSWLTKVDDNYLSAHYVIDRSGVCTQLVDPNIYIAFHAGVSQAWNYQKRKYIEGCNQYFIGIELVGDGNNTFFDDLQYSKLGSLCSYLMSRFPTIRPNSIIGHEEVSPGRKFDPGLRFDWMRLFKEIYTPTLPGPVIALNGEASGKSKG